MLRFALPSVRFLFPCPHPLCFFFGHWCLRLSVVFGPRCLASWRRVVGLFFSCAVCGLPGLPSGFHFRAPPHSLWFFFPPLCVSRPRVPVASALWWAAFLLAPPPPLSSLCPLAPTFCISGCGNGLCRFLAAPHSPLFFFWPLVVPAPGALCLGALVGCRVGCFVLCVVLWCAALVCWRLPVWCGVVLRCWFRRWLS